MYQELYDSTHIIVTIGSQALPALSRVPFVWYLEARRYNVEG
jgi:hypothetical protein